MPFGGLLTAGISAGSGLLSGIMGGKAAKKAAAQQQAQQQKAIDYATGAVGSGQKAITDAVGSGQAGIGEATQEGQKSIADQLAVLAPYLQVGGRSVQSLEDLAGPNGPFNNKFSFNPSDLQNDPGYKFTLQQGQDAINRSAAMQGRLFTGGTLKSLANFTTGSANQYFGDAFTRAKSTFDTNQQQALSKVGVLQGLGQLGYGAAGQQLQGTEFGASLGEQGAVSRAQLGTQGALGSANLGLGGAQIVGGALTNQGNAQAAGTVGNTNSWLGVLKSGNDALQGYFAKKYPDVGWGGGAPPSGTLWNGTGGTVPIEQPSPYGF